MTNLMPVETIANRVEAPSKALPRNIDVMALVFMLLVDSATTSTETALIHSKQLKNNANAQEAVNRQEEQLQFVHVPTLHKHEHHYKAKHHSMDLPTPDGGVVRKTWTTKAYTKVWYTGQTAVDIAQAKNDQIAGERQQLAQRMTQLEQEAQVHESFVNSVSDEAMQSMQEGSQFMTILRSLTFKALMTQPVQG